MLGQTGVQGLIRASYRCLPTKEHNRSWNLDKVLWHANNSWVVFMSSQIIILSVKVQQACLPYTVFSLCTHVLTPWRGLPNLLLFKGSYPCASRRDKESLEIALLDISLARSSKRLHILSLSCNKALYIVLSAISAKTGQLSVSLAYLDWPYQSVVELTCPCHLLCASNKWAKQFAWISWCINRLATWSQARPAWKTYKLSWPEWGWSVCTLDTISTRPTRQVVKCVCTGHATSTTKQNSDPL